MLTTRPSTISLVLAGLLMGGTCTAASDIPNLVGTWVVESEGGVLALPGGPRVNIHQRGEFSKLKGEAVVTKQEGRIVHGVFTSPRAKEQFIGAITMDNKRFYFADEDGMMEGDFIDNDKLNIVYRHVTPTDTVIGVGTWTRKP
jgi:hypothetical protein